LSFYRKASEQKLELSDLRVAAINLLSRREYSRHEIFQKLSPRAQDQDELEQVLDRLAELGYQSDQRFAESFLRSRIYRGLGQNRIVRELKEKGISLDMAMQAIEAEQPDWFELAALSATTKGRSLDLNDYADRQKLFRYLSYRGFTVDEIKHALEVLQTGAY
jgi:regulatory protein